MPSTDTMMLMDVVKEKTGYGVSVSVDSSISTHSGMISASQSHPMHLVKINPKNEKYGDYLLALQCAMLLIKWADLHRIPDFVVYGNKVKPIISKFSKQVKKQGFPSEAADKYTEAIVSRLIQQLNSMPCQLLCMDMIAHLCPSLEPIQREYLSNDLRELTNSFRKEIQKVTPKEIFNRNVSMNAAYAIKYARSFNSDSVLLPYRSMGFISTGERLMDVYDENIEMKDPDRYMKIVDNWARILKMEAWYEWKLRKEA